MAPPTKQKKSPKKAPTVRNFVHTPEFLAEAHRQSLAVAASPQGAEDQAFIDAASDWSCG
jgi:hypothetical protein